MNYGIGNVKELDKSKSLFTTTTAPTESGGVITLATTEIVESGYKVGDYLAYVDSDNISALYSISAISSGTATLSLIGNMGGGGGKQLYLHNIYVNGAYYRLSGTYYACRGGITIINDSNTSMTFEAICTYLKSKGFTCAYANLSTNKIWYSNVNIDGSQSSNHRPCLGLCVDTDNDNTSIYVRVGVNSMGVIYKITTRDGIDYIIDVADTVIPL